MTEPSKPAPYRAARKMYLAEFLGTALLVGIGLSVVTFFSGKGSPGLRILPEPCLRRLVTGFLFGTTGALIALSPLGKESGAHINPVVTLGFWSLKKIHTRVAAGYVLAQLLGGILGALPLLAWGEMGRSVAFGATLPGAGYAMPLVVLGEVVTTFLLIAGLFVFLSFRKLRNYTPALFPFLYALMVCVEAPLSGTSTNPARSLAPAIVAGAWRGWWVYWVGPVLGTVLAIIICHQVAIRIEVAKVYHFEHDPHGLLHGRPLNALP